MHTLQLCPSDMARDVASWPVVTKWLKAAIVHAKGRQNYAEVVDKCSNGKMQLWVVRKEQDEVVGTLVTEVRTHPDLKVCSIILLGGVGFDSWKHLAPYLEEWARGMGCDKLDLEGRPGWARKLFNGWNLVGVFLEKDLVHGQT